MGDGNELVREWAHLTAPLFQPQNEWSVRKPGRYSELPRNVFPKHIGEERLSVVVVVVVVVFVAHGRSTSIRSACSPPYTASLEQLHQSGSHTLFQDPFEPHTVKLFPFFRPPR
jgi:hypothetical protein